MKTFSRFKIIRYKFYLKFIEMFIVIQKKLSVNYYVIYEIINSLSDLTSSFSKLSMRLHWNHEPTNVRPSTKTRKHWTVVKSYFGTSQQCASTFTHAGVKPYTFILTRKLLTCKPPSWHLTVFMSNFNQPTTSCDHLPLTSVGNCLTSDTVDLHWLRRYIPSLFSIVI